MAPALTMKTYSVFPAIQATLTDTNGAIDLTSGPPTVKFVMKGVQTMTLVTGSATIVTPASGIVKYTWITADTIVPDNYSVEWAITWAAGLQIVPNSAAANQLIEIDADINGSLGLALCVACGNEAYWRPGVGLEPQHPDRLPRLVDDEMVPGPAANAPPRTPGAWVCDDHGDTCQVDYQVPEEVAA